MRKNIIIGIVLTILCPLLLNAKSNTSELIKEVIQINLKYCQEENLKGIMSTIHTKSVLYIPTKKFMKQLIPVYDLEYKLLKYEFIGQDEEYAYAKVLQSTKKISGKKFNNNELETLHIFKKEAGKWKLWSQASLSLKFK